MIFKYCDLWRSHGGIFASSVTFSWHKQLLLVPRSCTTSFELRSFGSSGPTACAAAHLRNLDLARLSLSDFRHCWKPLCCRLFRCSYRARLWQLIF